MDEGGVNHAIRVGCPTPQAVQVLERTAMHIGSYCGKGCSTLIRTSKAEHLMARIDEFQSNGRTDESCTTGEKDTHTS